MSAIERALHDLQCVAGNDAVAAAARVELSALRDELEALRNKVAVMEAGGDKRMKYLQAILAERDELVDTLKWALTCLGYYLDFHARPEHENYKAAECCDAIHSVLARHRALDTKAQL